MSNDIQFTVIQENQHNVINFRYGWVSTPVANEENHQSFENVRYEDLIPLESDGLHPCGDLCRPRIVIGHNVSYDRSKIKEQYWLNKTGIIIIF